MAPRVIRAACLTAVVVLALFAAAGCGGGGGSSSSGQPSAEEWANDVCSALKSWSDTVKSATTSLQSSPSVDALQNTATQVKDATSTLVDDLRGLGTPDTESGDKAKEATDKLADQLDEDKQKIEDATKDVSGASGMLDALSTVTSTLGSMATQFQTALSSLGQVDPKGELEDAFSNAESCKSLTSGTS